MTVRMLYYEFRVEYRPGKTSISDYTSRHPLPLEKTSPDMLMFGRELRKKLPERIVPTGEISYDQIRQRDAAKKKQMKEYADKRRNAR